MINKILSLIAVVAVALGLASCNDDNWAAKQQRTGTVRLSSLGVDVNTEASRANDIDVNNYIVEISQNGELVGQAYTFSKMPEVLTLPVGAYTVTVKSHEVQKAEWDNPYYLGSQDFEITENKITEIGSVSCYFSNVKVTIIYAEDLKSVMSDDCKVTVVVNDEGALMFGKDETRRGFFEAVEGSITMVAIFDGTVDGNKRNMRQTYTDVKAGQHYTITYSLKSGDNTIPDEPDPENTGSITMGDGSDDTGISISTLLSSDITDDVNGSISADDNTENVIDPGERPGTEDPEDSDDPNTGGDDTPDAITITSETLTFGTPVLVTDDLQAKMDIHSEYGIAHFYVTISSDSSNFMSAVSDMLPLSFDLAYPGDYAVAFAGLGFPVGNGGEYYIENGDYYVTAPPVIDQTDLVFNITNFMGLLKIYEGTHTFTLNVVDNQNSDLTKSLILKVVK